MAIRELRALRSTIELRPRYAETDQMGIVYHANYLVWFHEARDALLHSLGVESRRAEADGHTFPIVESHCRHLAPARYGETVRVSATPALAPGQAANLARLRVHYTVSAAGGRQLATGWTINAVTDHAGRMLLRLPAVFEPMVRRFEAATPPATER